MEPPISFHSICWSRLHWLRPFSFVCWCTHPFWLCHATTYLVFNTQTGQLIWELVDRALGWRNLCAIVLRIVLNYIEKNFFEIKDTWHQTSPSIMYSILKSLKVYVWAFAMHDVNGDDHSHLKYGNQEWWRLSSGLTVMKALHQNNEQKVSNC